MAHTIGTESAASYYIPCKIGDTVWGLRRRNGVPTPTKGKVSEIFFVGTDMQVCVVVAGVVRGMWGTTVFATEEDAKFFLEESNTHE